MMDSIFWSQSHCDRAVLGWKDMIDGPDLASILSFLPPSGCNLRHLVK